MQTGDVVQVTNMDGELAEGSIEEIHATTTSEWDSPTYLPEGTSLYEYWRGYDVGPDEPVVTVNLDGKTYDYPASRVEVLE